MKSYIKNTKNRHTTRGITLIESLIYVAILAIVFVIVVNTVLISVRAFSEVRVKREVFAQGSFALERMLREIRLADSVDAVGSTLGANPGVLKLNTIVSSSDSTATTREFSIASSTIMLSEGGATATPLTTGILITNFVFYEITGGGPGRAVHVLMTLENSAGRFFVSEEFSGTALLRRSY